MFTQIGVEQLGSFAFWADHSPVRLTRGAQPNHCSKLVFYAQSTSAVISGRRSRNQLTSACPLCSFPPWGTRRRLKPKSESQLQLCRTTQATNEHPTVGGCWSEFDHGDGWQSSGEVCSDAQVGRPPPPPPHRVVSRLADLAVMATLTKQRNRAVSRRICATS